MMTLRTIVALALQAACARPLSAGCASIDEIVRSMNRLIGLGLLRCEPLPRGEVVAVLGELERDRLVTRCDDLFTGFNCDCLECDGAAVQWSELNPDEAICHICAEIEEDRL